MKDKIQNLLNQIWTNGVWFGFLCMIRNMILFDSGLIFLLKKKNHCCSVISKTTPIDILEKIFLDTLVPLKYQQRQGTTSIYIDT